MIDWSKPIETVDGRKARKIQTVQNELWNIVFVPGENFGDVFLINAEGCICGDRTNLRISKPFIRNVRVKREGWILIGPPIDGPSLLSRIVVTKHIYPSEQDALRARDYYTTPVGTKAVFFQWEEEP